MTRDDLERRYVVEDSPTVNDLPDNIYMSDVSADKTCMAVIYKTTSSDDEKAEDGEERYMLTLYDLSIGKNDQKITRNMEFMEVDVSYIKTCNNPIYIFLSVFGKNGYVALSFVEMGSAGRPANPSDMFANCIIYGKKKIVQKIPFQGRAAFLDNRLALVSYDTLVVYEYTKKDEFKKKYTLDTQALSNGYEAKKHQTEIITDIPWAKYVELPKGQLTPIAGHDIISMSRHIQNNVLVTQYGSKDGNIVRVWSIFDGTLLTSYKSEHVEHVMAVSDNYRYIATYDEDDKVARIYYTKTSSILHTLPINTQSKTNSSTFTLSYMRFFGNGRYIIISGFVPDPTNQQDNRLYNFEVWCIPAQKLLLTDNQEVYWQPNILPFTMEFERKSKPATLSSFTERRIFIDQRVKVIRYGYQYNLPEMKAIFTSRKNQKIQFETKSLFKLDWWKSNEEAVKSWKFNDNNGKESTFKVKFLNKKLLDLKNRPELNDSLDITGNLFCCSIVNGTDHFVLRFGLYTVQLWRLKEVLSSVAESERKEIGFQLEEGEDQPYFFKSMEDNELVYIRAYKSNDEGLGYTSRKDWNINLNGSSPEVLFMDNIGHIFIKIEGKYEYSKNKKDQPSDQNSKEFLDFFQRKRSLNKMINANNSPKIINHVIDVDEIFLPLFNSGASTNNRSSTIDFATNSTNSEFHEIESACRALHHINAYHWRNFFTLELEQSKKTLTMMSDKIHKLIQRLLDMNKTVKFFNTVSGSRTLAMLASFSLGRDLLMVIIKHPNIPIIIFNYTDDSHIQESALTILIKERQYNFFKALFHRILLDTPVVGLGNLPALAESLKCLQKEKLPELLLYCFKKLSYIPVNLWRHPILGSEYNKKITSKLFQQDSIPKLQTLNSCSTQEQLHKYEETIRDRFLLKYNKLKSSQFIQLIKAVPAVLNWFIFGEYFTEWGILCIVPLPGFNDYEIPIEEIIRMEYEHQNNVALNDTSADTLVEGSNVITEKDAFGKSKYRQFSSFATMAFSSHENQIFKQPGTVMEVITQYKWRTFLKSKFYLVLFIHAVYYISYSTAVSFPEELYNYTPGDKVLSRWHLLSIVFMFISGSILLLQEIIHLRMVGIVYLTSFFNYVDIAAFTLPVANFCLLLNGSDILLDFGSVTILILWVHAILRLRVFSYFGTILEAIIQILNKITPFICIMFLVVFAFTHAFIYRLRSMSDQFFQEQYQGGPTDAEGNPLDNSTLITLYDTSSQNDFSNPFKAFSVVWFFIYGVFDPVNDGNAGDDTMTKILIILFSFVTILIFSNMVIALMSTTVDDVRKQGNFARLAHFSAVIGEIELLWCSNREKYSRRNNPTYIYYIASIPVIESHFDELDKEYRRLIEKWS